MRASIGISALPSGSTAASPALCVDRDYPTFPFMVRNTGNRAATLRLGVDYVDASGKTRTKTAGQMKAGAAWAPSPVITFVPGQLGKAGLGAGIQQALGPGVPRGCRGRSRS